MKRSEPCKRLVSCAFCAHAINTAINSVAYIFHLIELLKEQRRKEYVQKQKAKLVHYQEKIKTEAEKIQVLNFKWPT